MDRDTDRYRNLTRRALVLGGFKTALLGVLGTRLYVLQVQENAHYRVLAEENRINMRLLPPSRGQILDRFGVPLAINHQNFRVLMVEEQAGDVAETLDRLSAIVPLSEAERLRVLRDADRSPAFVPITVQDNLSWGQVTRLDVNSPELPGLAIEVGELRSYPFAESTGHVLGYVGAVTEQDLTGDPVLRLPGFRIGKTGLELQHDQMMRGSAGTSQVEVNAVGRVIRELSRDEGTPGSEVQVTVDIRLQNYVQERLKTEHSATAVVLDVLNGEIFALASHPGFDPNLFTTGIDGPTWRGLMDDPYVPLTNKAIAGQYPPGSTFKMLVALAALEDGSTGPHNTVFCPGHLDLGSHRFHCWRRGGHGSMDMVSAIAQSCDTYFYEIGRRVGIDKIAAMANRFAIGQETGLDVPGERSGLMPTRDWKMATLGQPWQPGETVVCSIGQGYVSATPLQLAVMTARLVNGGRAIRPHLTYRLGEEVWAEEPPEIGVAPQNLAVVVEGMEAVTRAGTARRFQIAEEGLEMGGKTGTSQVRRITMAERAAGIIRQQDRPWRDRHHGLFVGFAPLHRPRYACCVVVEHGGSSSVAAPIARDILLRAQELNPARPLVAAGVAPRVPAPADRG